MAKEKRKETDQQVRCSVSIGLLKEKERPEIKQLAN
jgi:hypothetical protein